MKYNYIVTIVLGVFLSSCCKDIERLQISNNDVVPVGIKTATSNTKTSISGYQISFDSNEKMTLVCEGKSTIYISNTESYPNLFKGFMPIKRATAEICKWYSIYPATTFPEEKNTYTFSLPSTQIAPFDESCNFMHSIKTESEYNEENMPQSLPLEMRQILGVIKISLVNSGDTYSGDIIKEVSISSPNDVLAGTFSFEVPDEGVAVPIFSGSENIVRSSFNSDETVGKDVVHDVYLFVNPTTISNATIEIITDKHIFRYTSEKSFKVVQGALTTMQTWDLNSLLSVSERRVVACWGNSYISRNGSANRTRYNESNYPDQLQELLGLDWFVYNGGYNGATLNEVIKHEKEWEAENDADLSIFYMERNEFPFYVTNLVFDYEDIRVRYLDAIDALTNKEDYIVCATHNRQFWKDADPVIVSETETQDYRFDKNNKTYDDEFIATFINAGRCVDLYHPIVSDWKEWLVRVGVYSSVEEIQTNKEFPGQAKKSNGAILKDTDGDGVPETAIDWPQSFWFNNNDHERRYVHPNKYGAKAMATLIYNKMQELGYLD